VCHVNELILQVNLAIFYFTVNALVKYYGQRFHVICEGHIKRMLSLQLAKPALQQGVCNLNIFGNSFHIIMHILWKCIWVRLDLILRITHRH